MSKSTKQASPYKPGQVQSLDHDFLVSFLEVDPEVKAAILGLEPSFDLQLDVAIPQERVEVLRSVEAAEDDDIVALTSLYAEIDSWSRQDAPQEAAPRRTRTPSKRSANVTAVELPVEPVAEVVLKDPAPKNSTHKVSAPKARKAPARAGAAPKPGPVATKQRVATAEVRTLKVVTAPKGGVNKVEIVRPPEPKHQVKVVQQPEIIVIEPTPAHDQPVRIPERQPVIHTPQRVASFETLAAQYDVIHQETLSLPAPRKREGRKPTKDLAFIAAQAQEGYNTWLATRSKYALQWDYMNFNMPPPPPPPRTLREARRIETRTMIKYYRVNASKSHAREDKRAARHMIVHARRGALQGA